MAQMYQDLLVDHPGAPVFYLSTGAWNIMPALDHVLRRGNYPRGPMLMTDWGPTNTGWFRSGQEHKRTALRRLRAEFPEIRWILIGDDGQHDPMIYREFAAEFPDHVAAIAIRELSPTEQFLSHGSPIASFDTLWTPPNQPTPEVFGANGVSLAPRLRAVLHRRTRPRLRSAAITSESVTCGTASYRRPIARSSRLAITVSRSPTGASGC